MSLSDDLRRQARHLATKELRRPLQASLRRAVSTAYYSLFHLLISEATHQMLGGQGRRLALRHAVGRGFSHDSLVAACKSVGSGTLPRPIASMVGQLRIPTDLGIVANTFVKLQDERHAADYDLSRQFLRREVLLLLAQTDEAFAAWKRVRSHDTSRFFLAALPLWKQMQR